MISDLLYPLSQISVVSIFDILLVTMIFYQVLTWVEGTQASSLVRGVLGVGIVAILVSHYSPFATLNWLIQQTLPALVVIIPIIFQPDLRRAFDRLGRTHVLPHFAPGAANASGTLAMIERVAEAAARLSERRNGGLIVIERATGLHEFAESGVVLESEVSVELLLTIFFPNSPLHDGAVIIKGDHVVAAGCVLPLAEIDPHETEMGLRHRAALGIVQQTDAVVVVVSEETSTISLAHNRKMVRHLSEDRLKKVMAALFRVTMAREPPPLAMLRPRSSQAEGA